MTAAPLLLAAALVAGPAPVLAENHAGPAPINGSVLLFTEWDFETVEPILDQAVKDGGTRVLFVVTVHCEIEPGDEPGIYDVTRLGLVEAVPPDGVLTTLVGETRAKWVDLLAGAFGAAADRGLAISILPHLDAKGDVTGWRNHFDFDPRAAVGTGADACGYQSAMIDACVEALHRTVPTGEVNGEPVEFALAGEMGRTVFAHPRGYMAVLDGLRSDPRCENWRVGVSFNHDDVAGRLPKRKIDADAMNRLLAAVDYVGISHYRPVGVPPTPADFARGLRVFADAFADLGTPLPEGVELHVSEVGLGGGGKSPAGAVSIPAETLEGAASSPYLGTNDPALDPFAADRPGFVKLRRDYYATLAGYLAGEADGDRAGLARATACHLWSMGSWDPLGWRDESFRDEEIAGMIRDHNAEP